MAPVSLWKAAIYSIFKKHVQHGAVNFCDSRRIDLFHLMRVIYIEKHVLKTISESHGSTGISGAGAIDRTLLKKDPV